MNNFFYLIILSILLGGSLYLLNIEISKTVLMNNYVYVILLLLVGVIVTLVYARYMRSSKQGIVNKYNVSINNNGTRINLIGYLDTGNNLMYRKKPVLILNKNIDINFGNKFIYVPFVTVGGSGVIKCFLVKDIIIDNKLYKNVYIGISNDKFYLNDADIILNVNLWEDNNERNY